MEIKIHENGFWLDKNIPHNVDLELARLLDSICLNGSKLVDFGCGNGFYVEYLRNSGKSAIGIEGKNIFGKDFIIEWDLSQKINFKIQADIILCLEVGEHIPKEYENIFLENLCNSNNAELLILSWAVEGQGGYGHINENNNDYVIEKLKNFNFQYLKHITNFFRKEVKLNWFKKSLMIFARF